MKVSIVLVTNRVGGFNLTFNALKDQTFPHDDFELVLVDDYKDREKLAFEYAENCDVKNLKYLRSKPNYWRSNRLISNARNTGLVYCEGRLVLFVDDYIWFPPRFLEEHWKVYKRTKGRYTMIGSSKAVKYAPDRVHDINMLPPPESKEEFLNKRVQDGKQVTAEQLKRIHKLKAFGVSDTRGPEEVKGCGGAWFYCMNASAPLEKIIEINGFDEEYDLTSEEDIDLGLRLERVGCKFWYRPCRHCIIFHMDHGGITTVSPKYEKVTYDELRKRGAIDSNLGEIQLVLKEKYGTQYDGSWGLHERNKRKSPYANIVDGKKIFDLRTEREKRGYWT